MVLSLVGVVLSVLGFGVAFALTRFGLDVFEVLHGPSDYLAASSLVVGMLFVVLADVFRYTSWWWPALTALGFGTMLLLVAAFALALPEKARASVKRCWVAAGELVRRWLRIQSRQGRTVGFAVFSVASMLAVLPLLWLLLVCLASAISLFTLIGDRLATEYLYVSVIEPTECAGLSDAIERRWRHVDPLSPGRRPYGATCLQVEAKGFQPIRGRRVIATSEVIVLFDPYTGVVRTVPRKDAVVTTLSRL